MWPISFGSTGTAEMFRFHQLSAGNSCFGKLRGVPAGGRFSAQWSGGISDESVAIGGCSTRMEAGSLPQPTAIAADKMSTETNDGTELRIVD